MTTAAPASASMICKELAKTPGSCGASGPIRRLYPSISVSDSKAARSAAGIPALRARPSITLCGLGILLQHKQRVSIVIVHILGVTHSDHAHPLLNGLLAHVTWRGAGEFGWDDDIGSDHADHYAD